MLRIISAHILILAWISLKLAASPLPATNSNSDGTTQNASSLPPLSNKSHSSNEAAEHFEDRDMKNGQHDFNEDTMVKNNLKMKNLASFEPTELGEEYLDLIRRMRTVVQIPSMDVAALHRQQTEHYQIIREHEEALRHEQQIFHHRLIQNLKQTSYILAGKNHQNANHNDYQIRIDVGIKPRRTTTNQSNLDAAEDDLPVIATASPDLAIEAPEIISRKDPAETSTSKVSAGDYAELSTNLTENNGSPWKIELDTIDNSETPTRDFEIETEQPISVTPAIYEVSESTVDIKPPTPPAVFGFIKPEGNAKPVPQEKEYEFSTEGIEDGVTTTGIANALLNPIEEQPMESSHFNQAESLDLPQEGRITDGVEIHEISTSSTLETSDSITPEINVEKENENFSKSEISFHDHDTDVPEIGLGADHTQEIPSSGFDLITSASTTNERSENEHIGDNKNVNLQEQLDGNSEKIEFTSTVPSVITTEASKEKHRSDISIDNHDEDGRSKFSPEDMIKIIPVIVARLRSGKLGAKDRELLQKAYGEYWPAIVELSQQSDTNLKQYLKNVKTIRPSEIKSIEAIRATVVGKGLEKPHEDSDKKPFPATDRQNRQLHEYETLFEPFGALANPYVADNSNEYEDSEPSFGEPYEPDFYRV